MTLDASYVLDAFLLMLGISIVLDLVVLVGTLRTLRIRKVRMLSGMALITIFVLVYLAFTSLILLGFVSMPAAYPAIILAFAILIVIYSMILKGMH